MKCPVHVGASIYMRKLFANKMQHIVCVYAN
jgi:hypothetical protein